MTQTINIIAHTEDAAQIEAIKAVIKAFKIKYTISKFKEIKSPYETDFVKKIQQGDEDLKNGKGKIITIDELQNLCK